MYETAETADHITSKLPQTTLAFWIMKIAATTLGETAGDLLAILVTLVFCTHWKHTDLASS